MTQTIIGDDGDGAAATGRLPVSCTLTSRDGPARLARWQLFNEQFLLSRTRETGRLDVRYRRTTQSATELRALVAAEKECCAFLGWTLTDPPAAPDELRLVITGEDSDLDSLDTLVG